MLSLGRYEPLRELGRGGMGIVWEAVLRGPADFRKRVALKVLHADLGPRRERDRDALLREARLGALLSHPNVVSVLDLGEAEGRWYIAMELVYGPTVAMLVRSGNLPAPALLEVGAQVCAGLAHIHGLRLDGVPAGLVHRDIKPENLLVDRSGLVKIADLGVAALGGVEGGVVGTPGFMPPEQLDGKPEARSDLFALGVVLYRLATGRPPFGTGRGATWATVTADERLADPEFLEPVDRAVGGLGPILARCLRADVRERWASAGELGAALRELRWRTPGEGLAEWLAHATPQARPDEAVPSSDPSASRAETEPLGDAPGPPAAAHEIIGRTSLIGALAAELGRRRLMTLVGPPGVGKTRVAAEVARAAETPAVWIDAAAARTELELVARVAGALRVSGSEPRARIGRALAARGDVLLVVDDLEGAAPVAGGPLLGWLEDAPRASILVTSRVPLHVAGEAVRSVPPLAEADAVALYRSLRGPGGDDATVARLVRALDALPLAIELAAARGSLLPPDGLLRRLDQRLRLLDGLAAALETSWELLDPFERTALGQLSVFVGAFDLEDAEGVVDVAGAWPLELVASLVDHSLVQADPETGRLRLLASVRAWAAERLEGGDRAAAEARHGARYAQLGSPEALAALVDPEPIAALDAAVEDLAAACLRGAQRGDVDVTEATALAALAVLERRGGVDLIETLTSAALQRPGPRLAEVLASRGLARLDAGRPDEALEDLLHAVAAAPDPRRQGRAHGALAVVQQALGHLEDAQASAERALALCERAGDGPGVGFALARLGTLALHHRRIEPAREWFLRALEVARSAPEPRLEAQIRGALGVLAMTTGRPEEATRALGAGLALARRLRDRRASASLVENLGLAHQNAGDLDIAESCLLEALSVHQRAGDRRAEATTLGNLALLDLWRGDLGSGAARYEDALRIHRQTGNRRFEGVALLNLGALSRVRGELEAGRRQLEAALGAFRDLGDPRHEGMALTEIGLLEAASERPQHAREALELAVARLHQAADPVAASRTRLALAELRFHDDPRAAVAWLDDLGPADPRVRVLALGLRARAALRLDDTEGARRLALEAAAASEGLGDPLAAAETWCSIAEVRRALGDPDAEPARLEALRLADLLTLPHDAPLRLRLRHPH